VNATGAIVDGRFRLEHRLGEGGFGVVYKATQMAFGVPLRQVAVKLSKEPVDDGEAQECFGDAILLAQVTGSCGDPSIRDHFVTVYDALRCGDADPMAGRAMTVMEFVPGGSLSEVIRTEAPFPLPRIINYMDQILTALAFMHHDVIVGGERRVVLHRDIKPSNILVGPARQDNRAVHVLKLSDFGLAVVVSDLLMWAQAGGDLAYMAPETFREQVCSPKSDVYGTGVVAYQMLTGRSPFRQVGSHLGGDDIQQRTELRQLHERARRLETFPELDRRPDLASHSALRDVIRCALSHDERNRFRDAREFRDAFRGAVERNVATEPPGTQTPWDRARALAADARRMLAAGDLDKAYLAASEAIQVNRDDCAMPPSRVVGEAYLVMAEVLIRQGQLGEAGRIAQDGYYRRRCYWTCMAMSQWQGARAASESDAAKSRAAMNIASRYRTEAQSCPDAPR